MRRLVRLRPLRGGDHGYLEAWGRDEEVRRHYFGRRGANGPLLEDWPRSGRIIRAVETAEGELLGWVELRNISWRGGVAELRVCLARRDRWGMGYGSAAIRAILAEAAGRRLRQVYLRVATWNRRAIRAYRKCGFRPRYVLRAGRRRAEGMADLLLMTVELNGE
jgi:RimJ/RimL family protein N-acetyltransferase